MSSVSVWIDRFPRQPNGHRLHPFRHGGDILIDADGLFNPNQHVRHLALFGPREKQSTIIKVRSLASLLCSPYLLNNPRGPTRSLLTISFIVRPSLPGVKPKPMPVSIEMGSLL
jgi:hypothetical protein